MPDKRFFFNKGPFKVKEILEILNQNLTKNLDGNYIIKDVASLNDSTHNDVCYFAGKSKSFLATNNVYGLCITSPDMMKILSNDSINIAVKNPLLSFSLVASMFYPQKDFLGSLTNTVNGFIDKSAQISSNAKIQPGVFIGANAVIGKNVVVGSNSVIGNSVTIGDESIIGPNSTIQFSDIGKYVIIDSGCRIGQEGFGFVFDENQKKHIRVPQLGIVNIANDVTIGANCTIDRGSLSNTLIGEGSRIDNQVHIGHNVHIGKRCIIVAQVGISGSCVIGDDVILAGQVGISDHVTIESKAKVAAKSGVMKDIKSGDFVMGYPAKKLRSFWREVAFISKSSKRK
ncbi:MAG: UDP-3-O-(3-hydroxymyristoyl)glucosamine N-acyltransferase [Pseudomonadota bacterium]|nr:UDP-3-O-(3-hydroxymyristoyl)glucosamine N-acyltransferase [Pseudomonadota bacterium]